MSCAYARRVVCDVSCVRVCATVWCASCASCDVCVAGVGRCITRCCSCSAVCCLCKYVYVYVYTHTYIYIYICILERHTYTYKHTSTPYTVYIPYIRQLSLLSVIGVGSVVLARRAGAGAACHHHTPRRPPASCHRTAHSRTPVGLITRKRDMAYGTTKNTHSRGGLEEEE